ncbi:MAG: amidohydrolase family protein [Dehalococcoidia bacterium]
MDDVAGLRHTMRRVDAHVHGFPDRLALAVRNHLNRAGGLRAGPLLADVAGTVTAEGFDAAWLLPYAHREGVAASINEWSADEARRFPHLIPGATFHPADENLPDLVQRALVELRLLVVKLHCSVGHFAANDRRLQPLWETAERLGVPVVIHAGQHSPGETAAGEIDAIVPVLRGHRQLRLVLAHAGHPNTPHALALMAEFDNLYADLTPVWDRAVQVSARDLSAYAGRFLFGSDAPNNPVAAGEQAKRFATIGLDEGAFTLLMGGTAERLIDRGSDEKF